jgi:uncharacterized protein (DUF427 family)
MKRTIPGPGQESVWDYPRPPRVEPEHRTVRVVLGDTTIAETTDARRVLETSHPPGIYLPPAAFLPDALQPNERRTVCEWKGVATYWDLNGDGLFVAAAGWSYADPQPGFESIAGYVSIYPGRVTACFLDDERVQPQAGGFYGGWITSEIVGPIKGGPGTWGW